MQTIKEHIPRIKRYSIILVLCVMGAILISSKIDVGITPVPAGAVYVKTFDNLDSIKSWSQLKQEHEWLNPERAWGMEHVYMNVHFNSWLEEFLFPKSVTAIHVTVESRSSSDTLQAPSILIIVLDQNERIRGKLYTQYRTRDYSLKETTEEYVFWFEFPNDMRGSRYSVIVELFGIYEYEEIRKSGIYSKEVKEVYDDIYGQIPYLEYNFYLLSCHRDDTKVAPPSSMIPWSLVFTVSAIISGSIGVFLVRFSKELWNYHLQHRELLLYESLCFLTLVLFIIFVFLIALIR